MDGNQDLKYSYNTKALNFFFLEINMTMYLLLNLGNMEIIIDDLINYHKGKVA